jgi:ectoine hydroxylase-related dioxygenase (phytanoyl-CoA dioxygenase family)
MITCWVPLDDTRADAGTLVYVRGSHRWPQRHETFVFHTDDDWLAPARAAAPDGVELDLVPVVVRAGGAAFHHHATLHGSAPNASDRERRSVVSHLVAADTEIVEDGVRRRLSDRNYPLLWHASAP